MIHRTPSRLARLTRAAGLLTAATAATAVVGGCDHKGSGLSAATAPAVAGTAGGSSDVGVLDPRRVFEALQWDAEQKRDAELAVADANRELTTFLQQLEAAVAEKRKSLVTAGKLTSAQADKLAAGDIDALPLTLEQKTEYRATILSANQFQQQARTVHQNVLTQRAQAVDRMYTEALRPPTRRSAQAAGARVVLIKQTLFYNEPAVEITDRVIDDLQKSMPPRTFPPFPKLGLPQQVKLDESPAPLTQPAAAPATVPAPTATKPAR